MIASLGSTAHGQLTCRLPHTVPLRASGPSGGLWLLRPPAIARLASIGVPPNACPLPAEVVNKSGWFR